MNRRLYRVLATKQSKRKSIAMLSRLWKKSGLDLPSNGDAKAATGEAPSDTSPGLEELERKPTMERSAHGDAEACAVHVPPSQRQQVAFMLADLQLQLNVAMQLLEQQEDGDF